MANPTTYFGWVMPTATDLVTDLPADFNVFGQGVDTSMQDLLGGTTGQVLSKTSATNMDFTWITPTASKIGQVLSTTKTDTFTTTSTSFTDITGLSQAITPVAASSKILVIYSVSGINTAGTNRSAIRMMRDSTAIAVGAAAGSRTQSTFQWDLQSGSNILSYAGSYLDSPATTSATTYKAQAISLDPGTTYVNRSVSDTDSSAFSRVTSTITVMEILA
jgi:hypothetical protein